MNIDELTTATLSKALGGQVDEITAVPVGTGQIGTCYRLTLRGTDVPPSMLAKLPATDPGTRDILANVYRTELRFYSLIAPTVDVRVPTTYYSEMSPESGDFTLLMEDLSPREQGDQLAGCSVAQARDAVVNLAGLHGPRWCDPTLLEVEGLQINGPEDASLMAELYGPATDIFVDGLAALLSDEDVVTLRDVVEIIEAWALARAERFGLVHGDYRLDNLMFPPDGRAGVVALDWQTLSLALPARDLAYFLSTGLSVEDRRDARAGPGRRLPRRAHVVRRRGLLVRGLLGGLPVRDGAGSAGVGLRLRLRHPHRARRPDVRDDGRPLVRRDPRPRQPRPRPRPLTGTQ